MHHLFSSNQFCVVRMAVRKGLMAALVLVGLFSTALAQTDATTPLHLLAPKYPVPYGIPKPEDVAKTLDLVRSYLEGVTPTGFINEKSGAAITDLSKVNSETILARGDFRIISYEWGVTYAGMLLAAESTGDAKFREYVDKRLGFIAGAAAAFKTPAPGYADWESKMPFRNLLFPRALDDTGAMTAAMIKATRAGSKADLRPIIDKGMGHIMNGQFRLSDGTLARNRPQPSTLWLDDLFMSVPAIAQMGKLTGERKYYDEATRQVLAFAKRMFNRDKGVYMHGWVEGMAEHPEFRWARANGWAFMTEAELLEVLPNDHPQRQQILDLYRAHAKGLASYQSGSGFWHQLLDREDSYLETSATAIYTYAYARGINRGWIDARAYAPMTLLAWNAVTSKINAKGQVEGTCVGTGMAFDPAFYYHRPTSPFAAHGYGPTLLAGAEVMTMLKTHKFEINDSSVQLVEAKP
jgi:unsaturated rhamnogalacturonyl hydrolase